MLSRYIAEKRGNVALLTGFVMLPMVLACGGGLDFLAYERFRSKLQDALDNGVLAAASLSQTRDADTVVTEFLRREGFPADLDPAVDPTRTSNAARVSATVSYQYETTFLKLAGIDSMRVHASSIAEEKRRNVEVSLMLDISDSMKGDRIAKLKPAAKTFVETLLTDELRPYTTISLVPYAGQVNVGETVFRALAGAPWHSNSYCLEMLDSEFYPGIPRFRAEDHTSKVNGVQVPHFSNNNWGRAGMEPWWCPSNTEAITYFSNDPDLLSARIDAFRLYDGTGTAYAVKWGSILLDPTIRPQVNSGVGAGMFSSAAMDRPADYDDEETEKFLILMTDGNIVNQPRPTSSTPAAKYYENSGNRYFYELFNRSSAEQQYKRVCDAAEANGVTVFTIAVDISSATDADLLSACATSEGHAYRIDASGMDNAFRDIASTIQRLKLVAGS